MHIIIKDNRYAYFHNFTDYEGNILYEKMTFVDENVRRMSGDREWMGLHKKFDIIKCRCKLTFLPRIVSICRENNLPFSVSDQRPKPQFNVAQASEITPDYLPGITLEDYQINSIKEALKKDFGIFKLTTGAGKTEILAGICKAIDCQTLVLADMTVVVSQIKDRLLLRLEDQEIGMFFAGVKPNGQKIVVGSIQSLAPPKPLGPIPSRESYDTEKKHKDAVKRWESRKLAYKTRRKNYEFLMQYVSSAEMIIVDECDRSSSTTYRDIIHKRFSGRKRFGFSATPYDESKPIKNVEVEENFGPLIVNIDRTKIEEKNRIIPIKYRMIHYQVQGFDHHNKINLDDAVKQFLIEDSKFHDIVFGICKIHSGEKNMILLDRIPLGEALLNYATNIGLKARFIYGKTPVKERDEALKLFANGELDALIGGKIINRGLDLKGGVDNLIIAGGGKMKSDFLQKIGRAVRVNKRGYSNVYDFLFRCNHYLYTHSKNRLEAVMEAGYESKILLGNLIMSGEDLVRRNFNIPKPKHNPNQSKLF